MTIKCPRKSLFLAFASALVLSVPHGFAQNPPSTPQPAPTNPPAPQDEKQGQRPQAPPPISVTVRRVVVPVTVKDKKGNLVFDLKRDEFRIFEDNVEQRITSFSVEVFPLSMIVLIDNDLKQKDASQVEPSLVSIVGGMSTSDEALVCRFDQFFYPGKGFTNNQDKLVTQLQRTQIAGATTPSVPSPGGPFGGPTINNAPAPGAPENYPSTLANPISHDKPVGCVIRLVPMPSLSRVRTAIPSSQFSRSRSVCWRTPTRSLRRLRPNRFPMRAIFI